MTHYDVFNGDADGLCSLRQLRLANPVDSIRITGIKRDVMLLQRVPAVAGDSVTVLDVSMDANRAALLALLERGVAIQYFDHHGAADIPLHPLLHAVIDTRPNTCTGILVDRYLGGAWREWAIAAAFGDNFGAEARALAATRSLPPERIAILQMLGECLNYNAYGDSEEDLVIPPSDLFDILARHTDPVEFVRTEPVFSQLRDAREHDLASVRQVRPAVDLACGAIYLLPDASWSRRIRGEFGNRLAREAADKAHAILTPVRQGGYTVSVRAPLSDRHHADTLCSQFPGGGGRAAAAGINHLPPSALPDFIAAFERTFSRKPCA
ncbi:MAG TPA: acetyltransferase [Noviherbaspirillum sp.]